LDQLEKRIDNLAHALTLAITAPASGATVSGTVTFTATCTCPSAHSIKSVCFYIWDERSGWVLIAEDTATPFTATFDSKQYSNGSHKLRAVGACVSGGQAIQEITVTISNVIPTGGTTTGGGTAGYGCVIVIGIAAPVPGSSVPPTFKANGRAYSTVGHNLASVWAVRKSDNVTVQGVFDVDTGYIGFSLSMDQDVQQETFTFWAQDVHGEKGSVTVTFLNNQYSATHPTGGKLTPI
jgi:hypothetical protein